MTTTCIITRDELVALIQQSGEAKDNKHRLLVRVEPALIYHFCKLLDGLEFQLMGEWFPIPEEFADTMWHSELRVVLALHRTPDGLIIGYLYPHLQAQHDQPSLRYIPVVGLGHYLISLTPTTRRK